MPSSPAKAGLVPPGSETRPGHPHLRGSFKATAKGGLQGRKVSGQGCLAWVGKAVPRQPHLQSTANPYIPQGYAWDTICRCSLRSSSRSSEEPLFPSPPSTSLFTSTRPHRIVPHGKRAFFAAAPVLLLFFTKAVPSMQVSFLPPKPTRLPPCVLHLCCHFLD